MDSMRSSFFFSRTF